MSYSAFTDKVNKPSEEEVIQLIGSKFKQWTEIDSYMVNMIKAKSAYKFYGKNYGWALGYSKNNKSIISLYPLPNDFTIQMIFKKKHEDEIMKVIDNNELLDLIKNTSEIHEGKWIFIKYSKINSSAIVKKMINIKLKSK